MNGRQSDIALGRLERSCEGMRRGGARISVGAVAPGIERARAFFRERAFAPHRHDKYAIGVTTAGVQTFRYRGVLRQCLPGQLHVLHPDELHDGASGTDDGFAYCILYVDPALVAEALGNRPLPFVGDPVVAAAPDLRMLAAAIGDAPDGADDLQQSDLAVVVADALSAMAGEPDGGFVAIDFAAVARARSALAEDPADRVSAAHLERIAGLDRWTLARQFRAAYGTSPHRFLTQRRLERARSMMGEGASPAAAAAGAGFADQSHMARQFKRAYGLTPGQWLAAVAAGREAA